MKVRAMSKSDCPKVARIYEVSLYSATGPPGLDQVQFCRLSEDSLLRC